MLSLSEIKAHVNIPSFGERHVNAAFSGDDSATSCLVTSMKDSDRASLISFMYKNKVEPAAFREALTGAFDQTHYGHYVLKEAGSRAEFVRWCRYAAYVCPESDSASFTIYRGVRGGSLTQARNGLSWSLDFDCAAWFSQRFNAPEPVVLEAMIPAKNVVFYSNERSEAEVIPATAPRASGVKYHVGESLVTASKRYRH